MYLLSKIVIFHWSCWFSGVYLEPNQIKPPTNSDFSTKGFPKGRIAGPWSRETSGLLRIRDRQITTNVKNQGEGCPTMYLLLVHIPLSQQWPGLVEGVMLSSYEEELDMWWVTPMYKSWVQAISKGTTRLRGLTNNVYYPLADWDDPPIMSSYWSLGTSYSKVLWKRLCLLPGGLYVHLHTFTPRIKNNVHQVIQRDPFVP